MSAARTFRDDGKEDDFLDWLVGNDDAIEKREQENRMATVLAEGGEVG